MSVSVGLDRTHMKAEMIEIHLPKLSLHVLKPMNLVIIIHIPSSKVL